MRVTVIGAGVAGLTCALEFAERGVAVEILERSAQLGAPGCSWFAGGMLAPWCELESCDPLIARLGAESIPWWQERFAGTVVNGTLVVAHGRDAADLTQFAGRTGHFEPLAAEDLAALEPDLAGRFSQGLYFRDEGHLDPRAARNSHPLRRRSRGDDSHRAAGDRLHRARRAPPARGPARGEGRDAAAAPAGGLAVPPGAPASSARAGVCRAAAGWAVHGGRHHDRER